MSLWRMVLRSVAQRKIGTLLTSFGVFRNCCSAGIITVEAKSGRVSRSMYCAMCFALAISFAAFFCSGL